MGSEVAGTGECDDTESGFCGESGGCGLADADGPKIPQFAPRFVQDGPHHITEVSPGGFEVRKTGVDAIAEIVGCDFNPLDETTGTSAKDYPLPRVDLVACFVCPVKGNVGRAFLASVDDNANVAGFNGADMSNGVHGGLSVSAMPGLALRGAFPQEGTAQCQ